MSTPLLADSSSYSDSSLRSSHPSNPPPAKREARKAVIRAVFGELLATFLFIFVNCGIATRARLLHYAPGVVSATAAIGAAFISIALIYSFSEISGGHFNPAVTLATAIRGKTSPVKSLLYVLFQLIGSNLAQLALLASFSDEGSLFTSLSVIPGDRPLYSIFFLEFFSTFSLVFVIFCTAFESVDAEKKKTMSFRGVSNSKGLTVYAATPQTKSGFAPLAIGFTIGGLVGLGGCFNPARLISASLWSGDFSGFFVFLFGQVLGAASAAGVEYGFANFKLDFYLPGYSHDEMQNQQENDDIQLSLPVEHRND